jgi:hypothetical protein
MGPVLAYDAAGVVGLWGVAHVLPTARVVHGFSDTSGNRWLITQEWVAEAMTMWFIAAVVAIVTAEGSSQQTAALLLTASWSESGPL